MALSLLGRRSGAHLNPAVTLAFWTQHKVHPHDLAGYIAAQLMGAIAAGAEIKVVQQMLGHKSATMTLDLYGHLFESRIDEVADALDKAAWIPDVAPAWPQGNIADLEAARQRRAARQTSGRQAVPPARIELATPGLGVRRSIH